MPVTRRSGLVAAPPEELWRTVGDPHQLPRWWPGVMRVEQVRRGGFTQVLKGPKTGRQIRADFRLTVLEKPSEIAWEQELEDSPFARVLRSARFAVRLSPDADGTRVDLLVEQRLQGFAFFGGVMVRRATKRQLGEALDGLRALHPVGG